MLQTLFDAPSLIWSLGASLAQPLFDGGRLRANVDFARAGYDATVANYRRVVLTAMQEVEDGIIGLAALERAYAQAQVAIASATRVLELATSRYEGGVATYLDVITAQQGLAEQRAPGRATAGPAAADLGVPGQGAGRRLAGADAHAVQIDDGLHEPNTGPRGQRPGRAAFVFKRQRQLQSIV